MKRILAAAFLAACAAGCWQQNVGRTYYASGKLKTEATVKNNVLDGPAVMYYENGAKMSEARYRAGVLDGKSTAYYESGAKKAEAQFKDGALDGTSTSWAENGAVQSRAVFRGGRLVSDDNPNPTQPEAVPGQVTK